jgi:phosphoglycolate phosphatase-like HAD superfamily hydrolase
MPSQMSLEKERYELQGKALLQAQYDSDKALVFDMDETLIDSSQKLAVDTIQAFSRLGHQITPQEARIDWQKLIKMYGISWEDFDKALDQRKTWEESLSDGEVNIFPETYRTLDELKQRGIRLGLLSLSIPRYTQLKLDHFNLGTYFEQVETVNPSQGRDKNHGAIEITRRLNPESLRYIGFVGDREGDVICEKAVGEAYKEYGLTTGGIYVNRNGNKLKGYPSITSLEGVLELI